MGATSWSGSVQRVQRTRISLAIAAALCADAPAYAQITTDGTLGAVQSFNGANATIPANLGRQAGGNLFHSFGAFNVPTGGSAIFAGPGGGAAVSNVISRVTGALPSAINGRLGLAAEIHGANLFLINPRGILFGPNASLDLTGSFTATTANYLKLADGTRFEAAATMNPVLTSAPPAAFGFLGPSGPITVQGSQLQAAEGRSISLVGGPISVSDASLTTSAGEIRLVGVGGAGEVSLGGMPTAGTPLAPISLQRTSLWSESASGAAPGRIVIRGGHLTVSESSITSVNYEQVDALPVELAASGDLTVSASNMTSYAVGSGRGADIALTGDNVTVEHDSQVGSRTFDDGRGGDVTLSARNAARVLAAAGDPGYTNVYSWAFGSGDGGNIRLAGDMVNVSTGNVYSYAGADGEGGAIDLRGREVRVTEGGYVYSYNGSGASGRSGELSLSATERAFVGGRHWGNDIAYVFTQTFGPGPAGRILVTAPAIGISDGGVSSQAFAEGRGGDMRLRAHDIRLSDGAEIFSYVDPAATGRGGDILIEGTGRLEMARGNTFLGIFSQTQGPGRGGDVRIDVPEIGMDFLGRVSAATYGPGTAGDIIVNATRIAMRSDASFEATAFGGSGDAGNIRIRAGESIDFSGRTFPWFDFFWYGGIYSRAQGSGNAGSILIETPRLTMDDARIQVTGYYSGNGGRIDVATDLLTLANGAQIDARTLSGSTGDAGSIRVLARDRLHIHGISPVDGAFSGINTQTGGTGTGGAIGITAGELVLDRGFVKSTTTGEGKAGDIDIAARTVIVREGGRIDASAAVGSRGDGGSITLNATESIVVSGVDRSAAIRVPPVNDPNVEAVIERGRPQGPAPSTITTGTGGRGEGGRILLVAPRIDVVDGARVEATSTGTGNAGSIDIAATDALRIFGGTISSEALRADGGNIDIRVGNLVHLKRGEITTAVGSGLGAGGNIFIDPTFVILEDGSRIVANAFGGSGGNIRIIATYFLNTLDTLVDASSQLGVPGTVQISSPNTNLSTQLKVLPAALFDATQLVREACAGRGVASGGGGSSLVGVGRGGLAASPERLATSTYFGDSPSALSSAPTATGLKLVSATRARLAQDCAG
jgi:filamentous hemagglutinin family protein